MQKEDVINRVFKGCQKNAVAKALTKPMTTREIYEAAKAFAPRIQIRDIHSLLRHFIEKGLIYCLYHQNVGSVFFWTEYGRQKIHSSTGIFLSSPPDDFDWKSYSYVARAKIRRMIFHEMFRIRKRSPVLTAEKIRTLLSTPAHHIGLRSITRAVSNLKHYGMLQVIGYTKLGKRTLYQFTEKGRTIAQQLCT